MNIKADFRNRCWPASSKLPLAQHALGSKIAVAVSLVASMSLAGFGQSFQNLDFDAASLVPVCNTYPGAVETGPALPGWFVDPQVPYVMYDNMFLDSAGVSIFDNEAFGGGFDIPQGKFSILLEAGFTLPFSTNRVSVGIAQAGTIPPSTTRMLFDARMGYESNFVVSISGQQRSFYALATFTNYTLYAVDVSEFAGQTVVLGFTSKPNPPPGPAVNGVSLDDIRFYAQLTDPMIVSQPLGQLVAAGETVLLSANAIGSPPLGYQWFFNGTTVVGARNSYLQLTNIQLSQAGTYRVVVSNVVGIATSAPALVSVYPRPTVLHRFTVTDGAGPAGALVSAGPTLYGTTCAGGSGRVGTVFKVSTDGSNYTVLHHFAGADGNLPLGALLLSGATLYGATQDGGLGGDFGVLFKIDTNGSNFTILKDFTSGGGMYPQGSLLLLGSTLYGTTELGGSGDCGVVFKVNTDGSGYTVLHSFRSYTNDGAGPYGGMVLSGTTLYGATFAGGSYDSGTLFKIQIDGSGYTLIKQFNGTEGANPAGDLVLLGATLYGTTSGRSPAPCGTNFYGTVFKINTDGTGFTVLHNFVGAPRDGAVPYGCLASCGGVLYGTTSAGGSPGYFPGQPGDSGYGTVFMISTDGSGYRVLKEFTWDDGAHPYAGLMLEGTTLYGTACDGGISGSGVVFALSLPIPNILTAPASQTVEVGGSVVFSVQTSYDASLGYQWFFNGTNALNGAAGSSLQLANLQFSAAGVYTVVVTNAFGAATSAPAMLSVIAPVERRIVPGLTLIGQPGISLNLDFTAVLSSAPAWTTFDHVTLTAASQWYFDLGSPLPTQGFYRAWQSSGGTPPSLDLHVVPALTLTGAIGSSVRVDYINQFGPIDAWVTNLATITLTNTSQLYFDTSVIGQPPRLYRIVPEP